MKLYDRLPRRVRLNRRSWRLRTDFRQVLRALDMLGDARLMPSLRTEAALRQLIHGRLPGTQPERQALLDTVLALLCPASGKGGSKQVMSMEQDADMIRAAFLQVYGIDLTRARLHWCIFRELLGCIPTGTRLSDVIDIRTRPLPTPNKHNAESIRQLREAKAFYALQLDDAQTRARYEQTANNLFRTLLTMAKRGDPHE